MKTQCIYTKLGIAYCPLVLPKHGTDLKKWAVIACDQFTSDPGYWKDVESTVGESPSTLHCVFPEIFLNDNPEKRIDSIHSSMENYLQNGYLRTLAPGCMFVVRKTMYGNTRKGIVMAVDLEEYEYRQGSHALIRATEKTILNRIPPRVAIREKASIEFPHILVLYNDPSASVNSILEQTVSRKNLLPEYDTELMKNGGSIKGYHICEPDDLDCVTAAFEALNPADPEKMLFAAGDGNHSLATAKTIWENLKPALGAEEALAHPARFALAEFVNLHDKGLGFEPIHRVIFDTDTSEVLSRLKKREELDIQEVDPGYIRTYRDSGAGETDCLMITATQCHKIRFTDTGTLLPLGILQQILDEENFPGEPDFIHGFDETADLAKKKGSVSFLLPPLDPDSLFRYVEKGGVLPRKTFSLGHAEEKRYYMEGKIIRNLR